MLLKVVKSHSYEVGGMLGVKMSYFLFQIVKNPFTDVAQAPVNSTRILHITVLACICLTPASGQILGFPNS